MVTDYKLVSPSGMTVAWCNAREPLQHDIDGIYANMGYTIVELTSVVPAQDVTPPAAGSIWRHRNGNLYRVEEIGNAESVVDGRSVRYPPTVWYRNTANNKPYNRRVDDWHRSMTEVTSETILEQSETLDGLYAQTVRLADGREIVRTVSPDHPSLCTCQKYPTHCDNGCPMHGEIDFEPEDPPDPANYDKDTV